jgi:c-di-GMP-binding flagellar brake protein YcgR
MASPVHDTEAPLEQVGDDERYRVHARVEIVALLRAVAAHREIVTVQFGGGSDFVVSAVLAVHPEGGEVVLDYGADQAAMQRLLRAPRLRVTTQLDHVRIHFQADAAQALWFDGGTAFRVPLPDSVLRLQRRDAYRLKIPLGRPLLCVVPAGSDADERMTLRVRDISVDGVGLTDFPKAYRVSAGMAWSRCRIDLPDLGALIGDLEVMHTTEADVRRCGCRFRRLPFPMATLIQRYITRVERERHAVR